MGFEPEANELSDHDLFAGFPLIGPVEEYLGLKLVFQLQSGA